MVRVATFMLMICLGQILVAQDRRTEKRAQFAEQAHEIAARFHEGTSGDRFDARRQYLQERKIVIRSLISVLKQSPPEDESARAVQQAEQNHAVRVLGEMRATEACEVLATILTEPLGTNLASFDPLENLPAAKALVQISGLQACGALQERLTKQPTAQELKVIALCLHQMDGGDLSIARVEHWLRTREKYYTASQQVQDVYKRNLESLLEILRAPEFPRRRD
jgi:hypothetical protein